MDMEFTSIDELKKRVMPAIKIRVKELNSKGYAINNEELWNYFVSYWKKSRDLTLADLVDDVLNKEISRENEMVI